MRIVADPELHLDEVKYWVENEIEEWKKAGKEIAEISLFLEANEVLIEAVEKSPIKRVRRITDYLSNIENFNEAKRAECDDRMIHMG